MFKYLYNDNIGYVTDEVSGIKPYEANLSEENRIKFVTDLAAVSRGKNKSNNPEVRYNALMKETRVKFPSRPLEFLPVVLELEFEPTGRIRMKLKDDIEYVFDNMEFFNKIAPFGHIEQLHNIYDTHKEAYDQFFLFTNMRSLIYAGVIYEQIPYANETDKKLYEQFKVIRANVPMFVWSQIMTHTQLSKVSQSDRVSENTNYWLPMDIIEKILQDTNGTLSKYNISITDISRDKLVNEFLTKLPQQEVQSFLKDIGYPKEIYSRAPYYFKYKEFVITGWYNNKRSWHNMLLERNAITTDKCKENWTQKETNIFALAVNEIINNKE